METEMSTNKRIQWIDVAKGICMIAVIAGHLGVVELNNFVYSFQITGFFILSGYTLKESSLDKQYLNKKFRSLMVPYFLTCFCVLVMDVINQLLTGVTSVNEITSGVSNNLIRDFLAYGGGGKYLSLGSVEVGTRIGAIWFLPALFFATVLVQILFNHVSTIINRFIVGFLLLIGAMVSANFIMLPFAIQPAMAAVPFLLLGYELKRRSGFLENFNGKMCICAIGLFLICYLLGETKINFVTAQLDDIVLSLISGISMSLVVFYCAKHLERIKPLAWVGRNSLLFLCVHLFSLNTMQYWFDLLREDLSIVSNPFTEFCLLLIFAIVGVGIINLLRRLPVEHSTQSAISDSSREVPIDFVKGILIIFMLIGTFTVLDSNFSMILFSFYAIAFVFFSGYFFNPASCRDMKKSICHLLLTLGMPYLIFSILYICMYGIHTGSLLAVLLGLSGTKAVLTGQEVIGYAGFLLMLFLVRLIYLILQKYMPNEYWVFGACFGLSVLGYWLGQQGCWLPWSLDLALYTLIFYHLGYWFRKYHLLEYFRDNFITYFILSLIWAYMVYSGSMNLVDRQYSSYGMVILGAISASILLYQCACYLSHVLPAFLQRLLQILGQSTLCILIIHTLFGQHINVLVSIWFTEGFIYYMVASIGLQVISGMLITQLISLVRGKVTQAVVR